MFIIQYKRLLEDIRNATILAFKLYYFDETAIYFTRYARNYILYKLALNGTIYGF